MNNYSSDTLMGIFPGDLIIKAALELGLEDLRKNPWVIEDCFKVLIENPMLRQKYGMKEIDNAKNFILNNEIPVYLRHRVDKQEFPCLTLSIGEGQEDKDLATLADQSVCVEDLSGEEVGRAITYIVPPFTPVSYDKANGIIEVPEDIYEYKYIGEGMVALDPETGNGYYVIEKLAPNSFRIQADAEIAQTVAIAPRYLMYRARRERATLQQTYNIGCHVSGDPATLIFLHSITKYLLFRYREGLLENNGFDLSRLRETDLIRNEAFNIENVYSRWLILSGQVEESWIKSPMRFIEAIDTNDPETGDVGIKILSQDAPEDLSGDDQLWTTVDPDE